MNWYFDTEKKQLNHQSTSSHVTYMCEVRLCQQTTSTPSSYTKWKWNATFEFQCYGSSKKNNEHAFRKLRLLSESCPVRFWTRKMRGESINFRKNSCNWWHLWGILQNQCKRMCETVHTGNQMVTYFLNVSSYWNKSFFSKKLLIFEPASVRPPITFEISTSYSFNISSVRSPILLAVPFFSSCRKPRS